MFFTLNVHISLGDWAGVVIKVANNLSLFIRFYDGQQAVVNLEEAYKISLFKFEHDVENIIRLEKRWVGEMVVAFTFFYELGSFNFLFIADLKI